MSEGEKPLRKKMGLGRGLDALEHRSAVDECFLDVEAPDVDRLLSVLGVGDRRLQELLEWTGGGLPRQVEDADSLLDVLAADQVDHEPNLLR